MFGRYSGDFRYSDNKLAITIEQSGAEGRYVREVDGARVEKILPPGNGVVVISPVEPVNLPEPLTRYLEISFPVIVLPPRTTRQILLTFPVEIGAFLTGDFGIHVLDIFSYVTAKYSLYGPPSSGQITRWHRSGIFTEIPAVDRLSHGILDLTIRNASAETVEVARTVLDSGSMHLFYGDHVTMAALMEIYSPLMARTSVSESAPADGLTPAIEIYTARRIPAIHGRGHLMESGVA